MLEWEDAEAPVVPLGRTDVPPLSPRRFGEMKKMKIVVVAIFATRRLDKSLMSPEYVRNNIKSEVSSSVRRCPAPPKMGNFLATHFKTLSLIVSEIDLERYRRPEPNSFVPSQMLN